MSDLETGAAEAAVPNDTSMPVATPEPASTPAAEQADTPEASSDADLQAIWDKYNPPRGEGGKFAPRNPAVEGEQPPATQAEAVEAPKAETVEQAPAPAIDPPVSLTAEMKAKFGTLPPDVQAYWAQRERESAQAISRYGQQVKQFEPIAQVVEQHRSIFERNGVTPEQGLPLLFKAQAMLDQDPVSGIAAIAKQYGIDLGALQGTQVHSPELVSLRAELADLKQQLAETSSHVRTREERELDARRQALEAQVSDFRKANPDFDLVEAEVISLIPMIRSKEPGLSEKEILAKAYDQAAWLNPDLRTKRTAAEQAKQAEAARKKAEEAKRLASLNVKSGTTAKATGRTLEEDLEAIAAKHYGTR